MYWGSCLPCHGDVGQGLTAEFRETYPPEEQYCWARGCHGERPYDDGFVLPTAIPAVIAPNALMKFPSASALHAYIQAAMPWWKPGSLSEEDGWAVTAFLLRANHRWPADEPLDEANAASIWLGAAVPTETPMPIGSPSAGISSTAGIIGGAAVLALAIVLLISSRRRGRAPKEN